jgi:hypothetical protein
MARVKARKDLWCGVLFICLRLRRAVVRPRLRDRHPVADGARLLPDADERRPARDRRGSGRARSLAVAGEAVERIAVWPQLLVLAAIVAFGLMIERVGRAQED